MTIQELDQKLNSPEFQDTENDLFYNYYIYQYPATEEYEMRRQIQEFKRNLKRPTSYQDVLTLNLFDEFCNFLDNKRFLRYPSMLHYLLEKEAGGDASCVANVQETLTRNAHSPEFLEYIQNRIKEHIEKRENGVRYSYVFLYGIGSMFPYLRVNQFLALYENYNQTNKYKIIVFYPGQQDGNSFRLFNTLQDNHTYRAILLLNENETF